MKRKITAVLILTVFFSLLTGCALDGSAYAGIGVIDLATDTTWNISWYTMEGRAAETLFQEEETVLKYSIESEAKELKVWVELEDASIELPLEGTELSLAGYKDEEIKIVVEVKGGKKSRMSFKLEE